MRFILILLLSVVVSETTFAAKPKKVQPKHSSKKVSRVVTVKKKAPKKTVAKAASKKKSKAQLEVERKALAKRQVEHARKIALLRKGKDGQPSEYKANSEVTIKDYGFEQTPPTAQEQANMQVAVTSEDIKMDNGTTPYVDGTAVYVERDTASDDADFDVDLDE